MENIKAKLFIKSTAELTNDYAFANEELPSRRYYTAKVVDNKDPDMDLRVKVRVYGLMGNEIPDSDLPWAEPEDKFVGSSIGSMIVPSEGTIVRVYFDNDDIYCPRYTSKVYTKNIPDDLKNDYPNNMAFFVTDEGDSMTINKANGLTTFQHRSGSFVRIDPDGGMVFKSVAGVSIEAEQDIKIVSATGSISLEAETGYIDLGKGAIVPVPNLPLCLANGSPHAICGQAATMKGIARVKK